MKLHSLSATCINDEKLYMVSCDFNALFCVDMKDWTAEYKTSFEEYAKGLPLLFNKGNLVGNTIYFMPHAASHVAIYHIEDNTKKYIEIGVKPNVAIRSCLDGEYLWLFYIDYPNRVVKLNLNTHDVQEQYLDWSYIFRTTGMKEADLDDRIRTYTILSVQKRDNKCWIVLFNIPGILLTYDVVTGKTEVHKIEGLEKEVFSSIVLLENCIWINITDKHILARWEYDTHKLDIVNYEAAYTDEVYSVSAHIGKYIIVARRNELVSLDITDWTLKTMSYSDSVEFRNYERIENKILFYPCEGDSIVIFDSDTNEISEHQVRWERNLDSQIMEQWYDNYIWREKACNLNEYTYAIPSRKKREETQRKHGSAGSAIWESVKQ